MASFDYDVVIIGSGFGGGTDLGSHGWVPDRYLNEAAHWGERIRGLIEGGV